MTASIPNLTGPGNTAVVEVHPADPVWGVERAAALIVPRDASQPLKRKLLTVQAHQWLHLEERAGYRLHPASKGLFDRYGTVRCLGPYSPTPYRDRHGQPIDPEAYELYKAVARFLQTRPKLITLDELEQRVALAAKHGVKLDTTPPSWHNAPAGIQSYLHRLGR